MRRDVVSWAAGKPTSKRVSKETLNHRRLIELVTGLDAYHHTPEAYKRAYQALGIDIINRVPLQNAPEPTPAGTIRALPDRPYNAAPLGVYDTVMRHTYPCATPEEVWDWDVERLVYEYLLVPVPHACTAADIRTREQAIGDVGLYYPMLYTTLFMWGVEVLGWNVFMMAAALEPDRFHDHFLVPCAQKSKAIVTEMARASDAPLLFVHDDLATGQGPVFRPSWYDEFVFPHYPDIWSEAKRLGKKIVFVADGSMNAFLPQLADTGVDGLMFESPATSLEAVLDHFPFAIGGIETRILTFGSADEVREMVLSLAPIADGRPGFAMASGGGLHANVPLSNLEAYFDARAEVGVTPRDWRTCCHI